jgi:hypothetical protein
MRLIDTSVVTGGLQYPGLANVNGQSVGNPTVGTAAGNAAEMQGLDFLQQALLDMVDAIARGLVVDITVPTIISAFPIPLSGGHPIVGASAALYVYYNGEVFYVPSYNDIAESGHYLIANITANPTDNGSTAPFTTLSDGSTTVSIHNQRTITISLVPDATPAGNFPSPSTWISSQITQSVNAITANTSSITAINALNPIVVGSGGSTPIYETGFSQANRLAFYKDSSGKVFIEGDAALGTYGSPIPAILPSAYAPATGIVVYGYWNSGAQSGLVSISSTGAIELNGITSASNDTTVGISIPPYFTV